MKIKWFCAIALSVASFVASAKDEFVAHEWGTFTSVQGADGAQIQWTPSIKTDLPEFVYSREGHNGGFRNATLLDALGKGVMSGFVRMETPVIYFYSDRERTADVRVKFPAGRVTEWYPQATHLGPYFATNLAEAAQANRSVIEWNGLKILAPGTKEISAKKLIRGQKEKTEHYYAARETDANFLRISSPQARTGVEYERDLFYRGVGFFQAPLTIHLNGGEDQLRLSTSCSQPLTDLFVLTIRNGQARYQTLDRLEQGSDRDAQLSAKPLASLNGVRANLMREMAAALVKQGLYAKEAQAMVETWKDQWFAEEGTRVLYLLPRVWTDGTLPLEISPAPASVARVMVGRAELITPSMERELGKQVVAYMDGDINAKLQAVNEVRAIGLGRFLEPATRKMLGKTPNPKLSQAAWHLAQEVNKTLEGKAPAVVEKQLGPVVPKTAAVLDPSAVPNFASF
ncbi:MAG TPA: hypothetical protein VGF13_11405 [Verrucomicrobiae bacterium]